MNNEDTKKKMRELRAEEKRLTKYIDRSASALRRNTKKLKRLQREREQLLTPMLPGLFD